MQKQIIPAQKPDADGLAATNDGGSSLPLPEREESSSSSATWLLPDSLGVISSLLTSLTDTDRGLTTSAWNYTFKSN